MVLTAILFIYSLSLGSLYALNVQNNIVTAIYGYTIKFNNSNIIMSQIWIKCITLSTLFLLTLYALVTLEFTLASLIAITIIIIGGIVVITSLDYMPIIDHIRFLIYLMGFIVTMVLIVICNNLIHLFLFWELLGLLSYLLINFYPSRLNCGIKAIMYNRVGDICLLSFIAYTLMITSSPLSSSINLMVTTIVYYWTIYLPAISSIGSIFHSPIFIPLFSLFLIPLTKSAQLPFSNWLINAMSAPTPISALLHSSTMVIMGIYLIYLLYPIYVYYVFSSPFYTIYIFIIVSTLFYSLISAIIAHDIKTLIAYSTVSQLSYMFIALLVSPYLMVYHVVVHAFFKSTLFLVAGALIHGSNHYQNLYKLHLHKSLFYLFLVNNTMLVLSSSKELIVFSAVSNISSTFLFYTLILSTLLTLIYTIKIMYIVWFRSRGASVSISTNRNANFNQRHYVLTPYITSIHTFTNGIFKNNSVKPLIFDKLYNGTRFTLREKITYYIYNPTIYFGIHLFLFSLFFLISLSLDITFITFSGAIVPFSIFLVWAITSILYFITRNTYYKSLLVNVIFNASSDYVFFPTFYFYYFSVYYIASIHYIFEYISNNITLLKFPLISIIILFIILLI